MVRKLALSVVLLSVVAVSAIAGEVTAFAPGNVVVVAPKEAPVSIASFAAHSDAKKLYVSVSFRNEVSLPLEGARLAMMVFDADRNVIAAATHRASGSAEAGATFATGFEIPLVKAIDPAWQVMVVPVEAAIVGEAGWQVRPAAVQPLVERMKQSSGAGAQHALATDEDLLPRGVRVQLPPYNCTLSQCGQNNQDCNDYCAIAMGGALACAYCDRRRTGEGCSTTCYCVSFAGGECGPNPYL